MYFLFVKVPRIGLTLNGLTLLLLDGTKQLFYQFVSLNCWPCRICSEEIDADDALSQFELHAIFQRVKQPAIDRHAVAVRVDRHRAVRAAMVLPKILRPLAVERAVESRDFLVVRQTESVLFDFFSVVAAHFDVGTLEAGRPRHHGHHGHHVSLVDNVGGRRAEHSEADLAVLEWWWRGNRRSTAAVLIAVVFRVLVAQDTLERVFLRLAQLALHHSTGSLDPILDGGVVRIQLAMHIRDFFRGGIEILHKGKKSRIRFHAYFLSAVRKKE